MFLRDENSLLCNYILVRSITVGGPTERNLPSSDIDESYLKNSTEFIFNGNFQMDEIYLPLVKPEQLPCFKSKLSGCKSIESFQNLYSDCLQHSGTLSMEIVMDLLQYFIEYVEFGEFKNGISIGWTQLQSKMTLPNNDIEIDKYWAKGIDKSCEYARYLVDANKASELRICLKQLFTDCSWKMHRENQKEFDGYDWFTSTIAIIFQANGPKTIAFQWKFSKYLISTYLWSSKELDYFHSSNLIRPMSSKVWHWIETITELEVPRAFSAIMVSGCTTTQV